MAFFNSVISRSVKVMEINNATAIFIKPIHLLYQAPKYVMG